MHVGHIPGLELKEGRSFLFVLWVVGSLVAVLTTMRQQGGVWG